MNSILSSVLLVVMLLGQLTPSALSCCWEMTCASELVVHTDPLHGSDGCCDSCTKKSEEDTLILSQGHQMDDCCPMKSLVLDPLQNLALVPDVRECEMMFAFMAFSYDSQQLLYTVEPSFFIREDMRGFYMRPENTYSSHSEISDISTVCEKEITQIII
ncbi:MAG: hypothetical protein HRU15_08855 [Planctomycetes bacterium]|nr:hypothetical protein [Planctomycetota bacterium]